MEDAQDTCSSVEEVSSKKRVSSDMEPAGTFCPADGFVCTLPDWLFWI